MILSANLQRVMLYLGFNPNAICATVCGSQIKKTILYLEG
jgi:hypothetical protein